MWRNIIHCYTFWWECFEVWKKKDQDIYNEYKLLQLLEGQFVINDQNETVRYLLNQQFHPEHQGYMWNVIVCKKIITITLF